MQQKIRDAVFNSEKAVAPNGLSFGTRSRASVAAVRNDVSFTGTNGNDSVKNGTALQFFGQAGNDSYQGAFVGLFEGGTGNDTLVLNAQESQAFLAQAYRFSTGDGNDVIDANRYDVIREGVSQLLDSEARIGSSAATIETINLLFTDTGLNDLVTERDGDDFIIRIQNSDDSITLRNFGEEDFVSLNFGSEVTNTLRLSGSGVVERATSGAESRLIENYRNTEYYSFVKDTLSYTV